MALWALLPNVPPCNREGSLQGLCRLALPEAQVNNSGLRDTQAIWEGNSFAKPRASAKEEDSCGNSLPAGMH